MLARMLQRRGTAAQWEDVKNTVILAAGEIGLETDTGKFKVGDGVTVWNALSYYLRDSDNDDIYSKLTATQTFTGTQTLSPANATSIPLEVRGVDAQSAKLQRWRVGIGAPVEVASIDASGKLTANGAEFNNDVDVNGNTITGLTIPVDPSDATNKQYVDDAIAGLAWKEAVHLIAHGAGSNVALTGATGTLIIDGHDPLVQADSGEYRLLLTSQTTASENGIYLYTDNGTTYTLTRTTDADAPAELKGSSVYVQEGTTYGTSSWVQSNYTIDSFDDQVWVQFSGAALITAGDGLTKDGNTLDVVAGDGLQANIDSIQIATGGVTSAMIANGTIVDEDISSTADISPAKIDGTAVTQADTGTVSTTMIADDAVTNDKIANNAVGIENMQDDSVGTAELVDGAVTSAKIFNGTIVNDDISNTAAIAQSKVSGLTDALNNKSDITHTHTLDNLSDVTITAPPADRQVLKYKGSPINAWVNEVPSGGISIGATPPVDASSGDAWFDSTDGSLYVYYDDGVGQGYQSSGTSTETVSHSYGYSTTLLVSWSHDEANSRYDVDYTYTLRATTSFFSNQALLGQLAVNGNVVWTPSVNYSVALNQTIVLVQGSTTVAYAPSTDLSMTWSGTVMTANQGLNLLTQATVTVGPELLVDVSPFTTSAQWVQVKANSALEGSILTRMSAVEARTTDIEAANAVRVSSMAERNSVYPAPAQGNTVFRADLGYEEKYYAAYNATTNPDGTKGTVGWYRYAGGAPLSQNYIINGGLDIWQRGTSISNPGTGTYTADRWQIRQDGSGFASAVSRVSLTPSESQSLGLDYALGYQVTNAGSSNTYRHIGNVIENVSTLSGKTVTVSYWAKTNSGSATISLNLRQSFGDGGSTQTFTGGNTETLTSTWTKYFSTINIPSIDGKTIGSGSFLQLLFILPANATFNFSITGVQLEEGPVPTPFRRNQENIQAELAACQRYYYRNTPGINASPQGQGYLDTTSASVIVFELPVTMRIAPTSVDYSNVIVIRPGVGSAVPSSITINAGGNQKLSLLAAHSAIGTSAGVPVLLRNNAADGYIGLSAEL